MAAGRRAAVAAAEGETSLATRSVPFRNVGARRNVTGGTAAALLESEAVVKPLARNGSLLVTVSEKVAVTAAAARRSNAAARRSNVGEVVVVRRSEGGGGTGAGSFPPLQITLRN